MARYIDADEIRWDDHYDSNGNLSKYKIAYSDEMPPAADVIPAKRGKWNCSDDMYETAVCSCCGWDTTEPWTHIKQWFNFCPYCGARMDGDHDS